MSAELRLTRMYGLPERLWHWLQALAIVALLLTGFAIHWPGLLGEGGLPVAVAIHRVLGLVLLADAVLGLVHHLRTGEIRQYLPEPRSFLPRIWEQVRYYSGGIFRGAAHPFVRSRHRKFNPLQQATYLVILNVLLPAQVLSGLALWGAQHWPAAARSIGGPGLIAGAHTVVAWCFASFLIMHLYLITTGPTPLAYLRSMLSGWEKTHAVEPEHTHAAANA